MSAVCNLVDLIKHFVRPVPCVRVGLQAIAQVLLNVEEPGPRSARHW